MNFLFLLIIAAVAAYLLRSPLKAHPSLFYSIAARPSLLLWCHLRRSPLAVDAPGRSHSKVRACRRPLRSRHAHRLPRQGADSLPSNEADQGRAVHYRLHSLPRAHGRVPWLLPAQTARQCEHQQQCCRRLRRGRRTLRAARSSWRDVPRHREAGHEQPSLDAHPAIRLLILRSDILPSCAHASSCCPTRRRCRPRIAFRVYGGVRSLRNTAFGQSCCGAP